MVLLKSDYRLELSGTRRSIWFFALAHWDLFDLLLAVGADLKSVDVYTVLNTPSRFAPLLV